MVPHAYSNRSNGPARFLAVMTPSGFEGYFHEIAALIQAGHRPDPAVLEELNTRYDQVLTTLPEA